MNEDGTYGPRHVTDEGIELVPESDTLERLEERMLAAYNGDTEAIKCFEDDLRALLDIAEAAQKQPDKTPWLISALASLDSTSGAER